MSLFGRLVDAAIKDKDRSANASSADTSGSNSPLDPEQSGSPDEAPT